MSIEFFSHMVAGVYSIILLGEYRATTRIEILSGSPEYRRGGSLETKIA